MANWSDPWANAGAPQVAGTRAVSRDEGLRSYMLSGYNCTASGVLLPGVVALLFARSPYMSLLFNERGSPSGLGLVVMFAPLGIALVMSFGFERLSEATTKALFWGYTVLLGLSLSTIFLVYTGTSIAQTFFATAAAFAGLSLYGYTTKRDLAPFGTFLIMGVFGILIAMLINMFLKSTGLDLAISILGVLIFAGLAAFRTQEIKNTYYMVRGTAYAGKAAVMGALQLYVTFINMFLFLLRFMGDRR